MDVLIAMRAATRATGWPIKIKKLQMGTQMHMA
jgi:hypothetical protein